MSGNTVTLHRVMKATPERLYRAFLDADALVKWCPPHGFTGKVHSMDARVGGGYKMSFTNFNTGKSHSFGGTYLELKPNELIRYNDQFDDPNLPAGVVAAAGAADRAGNTRQPITTETAARACPLPAPLSLL